MAFGWICCLQLLCHPRKNQTHSTSSYSHETQQTACLAWEPSTNGHGLLLTIESCGFSIGVKQPHTSWVLACDRKTHSTNLCLAFWGGLSQTQKQKKTWEGPCPRHRFLAQTLFQTSCFCIGLKVLFGHRFWAWKDLFFWPIFRTYTKPKQQLSTFSPDRRTFAEETSLRTLTTETTSTPPATRLSCPKQTPVTPRFSNEGGFFSA